MPWYQQFIRIVMWLFVGYSVAGLVVGGINDMATLITFQRALVITALILCGWLAIQVLFYFRALPWRAKGEIVRITKLNWAHHMMIAGVVLLVWLPLVIHPPERTSSVAARNGPALLRIISIKEVNREALWGFQSFDDDEVVVTLLGRTAEVQEALGDLQIIVFWRLAQNFETNWHVGKRRLAGNYELVSLDVGQIRGHEEWELLVGGIECEKSYNGTIAIALVAAPKAFIDSHRHEWVRDNLGWGEKELPVGPNILRSPIKTFETKPTRS